MRIRMITGAAGPRGNWIAGQVADVPDDIAKRFIEAKAAEAVTATDKGKPTPAAKRE
jgi:hypothetical protein